MKILRQKIFVEESERFIEPPAFPIDSDWEKYPLKIKIEESNSYKKDYKSREHFKIFRDQVKEVRKSIKKGYIYTDLNPKEKTHYYKSDSIPEKLLYVSKNINLQDRLMYEIYAPELIEGEGEDSFIQILIKLRFCSGHTTRKGKKFSETNINLL